jgi:transposase-like protein
VRQQISRQDAKGFNARLKEICVYSRDYDPAKHRLEGLLKEYEEKYPSFIKYVSAKKGKYLSFMKYPGEVRKHIYTTNAVESFNAFLEGGRHNWRVVPLLAFVRGLIIYYQYSIPLEQPL